MQRQEVEVHPGILNRVDLVLEEPRRVRISGRVSTAELGTAPRVMRIEAHDRRASQTYTATTNPSGEFVFEGLPASRYSFSAWSEDVAIAGESLDIEDDVTDLVLVARPSPRPDESE